MNEEKLFSAELFFAALADNTRLRLLNLMGDTEVCVCYFVEIIGPNQPKISRHLAYLRKAGLVTARQDGKWVHYKLAELEDQNAARVLTDVQEWLSHDQAMQRDREKLTRLCCAPVAKQPVTIKGAPRPASLTFANQ